MGSSIIARLQCRPDQVYTQSFTRWRSSRVLWLWLELKAIYGDRLPTLELVTLDPKTFRSTKPAELLQCNPNGKVPTLVHGTIVMWDSCAILLYLLDRFDLDEILAPRDPVFRARMYKLMFYCSGTVDNLTATSSPVQRALSDLTPGNRPEVVDTNRKAYRELVGPIIAAELGSGPWLAGESFTVMDIVLGYNMEAVHGKRDWWEEELTVLQDYYKRLTKERPLYLEAFKAESE